MNTTSSVIHVDGVNYCFNYCGHTGTKQRVKESRRERELQREWEVKSKIDGKWTSFQYFISPVCKYICVLALKRFGFRSLLHSWFHPNPCIKHTISSADSHTKHVRHLISNTFQVLFFIPSHWIFCFTDLPLRASWESALLVHKGLRKNRWFKDAFFLPLTAICVTLWSVDSLAITDTVEVEEIWVVFSLTIQINLLSSSDSDNRSDSRLRCQTAAALGTAIRPRLILMTHTEIRDQLMIH